MVSTRFLLALAAAVPLVLGAVQAEEATAAPLGNEEIVRMLVSGSSPQALREAIASRPPDFDLSDDMVVELRNAGVSEDILAAMRARQADFDRRRAREAASAPPDAAAGPVLHLRLSGYPDGSKEDRALVLPDWIDDALAKRLQLGWRDENRVVSDVAVFAVCTTAHHVPDQWRMSSPLGRDFVSMRRHQMLEFHPGAVHLDAREALGRLRALGLPDRPDGKPAGYLRLGLPEEMTPLLTPGEAHDLEIGVAVRVGDIWLALATARREGVVVPTEGTALPIVIRQRGKAGFDVEISFPGETPKGS